MKKFDATESLQKQALKQAKNTPTGTDTGSILGQFIIWSIIFICFVMPACGAVTMPLIYGALKSSS